MATERAPMLTDEHPQTALDFLGRVVKLSDIRCPPETWAVWTPTRHPAYTLRLHPVIPAPAGI